jgi:hypothetical protein
MSRQTKRERKPAPGQTTAPSRAPVWRTDYSWALWLAVAAWARYARSRHYRLVGDQACGK